MLFQLTMLLSLMLSLSKLDVSTSCQSNEFIQGGKQILTGQFIFYAISEALPEGG